MTEEASINLTAQFKNLKAGEDVITHLDMEQDLSVINLCSQIEDDKS